MPVINENYIQFFTAVCTDWLPLLKNDEYKDVIIRALKYRVQTKEVGVTGFVIMPNPCLPVRRTPLEQAGL